MRHFVDAAESAAEARDASALKDLVADDYRDRQGRTAGDVRSFLHGWLIAHPSVNLVTRIDALELEGTERARVEVTVGLLGREAKGDSDWSLALEVERLEVRLALEDGEWKVIAASQL